MKAKKVFTGVLCAILLISTLDMPIYAAVGGTTLQEEIYPGEEGESITFQSTDDFPVIAPKASYQRGDLIYRQNIRDEFFGSLHSHMAYYYSSSPVSKKFVKYLTSSWAKSMSYTWSKSVSVGITGSGEASKTFAKEVAGKLGLSISRTTTYGVAITIPADSSRDSKLGFASDYTKYVYDYKYYKDGALKKSSRDTYFAPEKDTYLVVYYKA